MNIKDIVKDNTVYFLYYRQMYFYYGVDVGEQKFSFPINIRDLAGATLLAEEKAIMYMRYIRQAMEEGTFILQDGHMGA